MSVKKKDRHISKQECLQKSRELINYLLILVRPREFNELGKQVRKPGILGEGQAFQMFGADLFKCGKTIHATCYQACEINLKNEASYLQRKQFWEKAIEFCNSILRQLDLCIYLYALNNQKKRKSFEHLARLTKEMKNSLQDRLNRDKLIYEQHYS